MDYHLLHIHLQLLTGADFEIFQHSKKLMQFQFPILYSNSLLNLIEIANEDSYNVTNTEF